MVATGVVRRDARGDDSHDKRRDGSRQERRDGGRDRVVTRRPDET